MQDLPLKGFRIISFEHFGAGPYATLLLASFGAEVIRVESPVGEHARRIGPPETLGDVDSLYYQTFSLNKKSIVLDMRTTADTAVFHGLVKTADAVINNLRGSLPAKIGLDYPSLKGIKPDIVCGHISAYGRENSRKDRPGFDFLMQAEAGLMSMTGEPGTVPARMGVSIIDHMTGLMLAFGVSSALHGAKRSGIGCDIDASLFDTALHNVTYQGTWYLNEDIVTRQIPRSGHPTNTPCQLFRTSDGWLFTGAMTDRFWEALCKIIGRNDLLADPELKTNTGRLANRDALTTTLDATFSKKTSAEWGAILEDTVPVAPVYSLDQALDNPFALNEAEMINEIEHPTWRKMRVVSTPLRINGKRPPQKAAPALGEHSEQLRREAAGGAQRDSATQTQTPFSALLGSGVLAGTEMTE